MADCKPVQTPMEPGSQLVKNTGPIIPESIIKGTCVLFMSIVSSMMYAMLGTYPDLAYAVGM